MMFITLIIGLIAGPAVSLYGSPTVSPVTAAACALEPLPPKLPSSMYFLALSYAPPPVVIWSATKRPTTIVPSSIAPSAWGAEQEPTIKRRDHWEDAGDDHLPLRGGGHQRHTLAVLGLGGALHDPGDLAELAPYLDDDLARRAADRQHREGAKEERHDAAEEQTGDDRRGGEIERNQRQACAIRVLLRMSV